MNTAQLKRCLEATGWLNWISPDEPRRSECCKLPVVKTRLIDFESHCCDEIQYVCIGCESDIGLDPKWVPAGLSLDFNEDPENEET